MTRMTVKAFLIQFIGLVVDHEAPWESQGDIMPSPSGALAGVLSSKLSDLTTTSARIARINRERKVKFKLHHSPEKFCASSHWVHNLGSFGVEKFQHSQSKGMGESSHISIKARLIHKVKGSMLLG